MSLLQVRDLAVTFPTPDGPVRAVQKLSFDVAEGHTLGVVGESGSGKSAAMLALLGLSGGRVTGQAFFQEDDLLSLPSDKLRAVRGAAISMVFQDPLTSLHPQFRVGWQIIEAIRAHRDVSRTQARREAVNLLDRVGIPQPWQRVNAYPHEFSGGMRQRVMIAMALALQPRLLIADEPTTALDVTVQAQIVELIKDLQAENAMAVILITHDLGVVAGVADDVLVMYAGKAIEHAGRRDAYYESHHPYTLGLLRSLPATTGPVTRLRPIIGTPPSMIAIPQGCPFHPRCPYVFDRCPTDEPPLMPVGDNASADSHTSACWLPAELTGLDPTVDEGRDRYVATRRGSGEVQAVLAQRSVPA